MSFLFLALLRSFLAIFIAGSVFAKTGDSLSLATSSQKPIDVVLDLDWTLLYEIEKSQFISKDKNYIEFEGKYFRLTDGVSEFVQSLLEHPQVRISIYTGASKRRADKVLKAIDLKNGKTLFDTAFQTLTYDDLEPVENKAPDAKISERLRKNLKKIFPTIDLDRTVIVEDLAKFTPPDQERNVLWLQETYKFREGPQTGSQPYEPPNAKAWALERNKLAWALGILTESIYASEKGESFLGKMGSLLYDPDKNLISRTSLAHQKFYEIGLERMKIANAKVSMVPLPFKSKASASGRMCRRIYKEGSL